MSDLLDDVMDDEIFGGEVESAEEAVEEENRAAVKSTSPIPQVNGANIRVDSVEDLKTETAELLINVDTSESDVVEYLERFEKVELIFPKGIFLKLSEGTVKRLGYQSMQNYFIAQADYQATVRQEENQKRDPTWGKIQFLGGDVSHEMRLKGKEEFDPNKEHFAILNDYDLDSAEGAGYKRIRGKDGKLVGPIRNTNPDTKQTEELYKVALPKERFLAHQKAVSEESKRRVRNRKITRNSSTIEITRDTIGTEVYDK